MNLNKSIWFFDIDDTIIDTAGANVKAALGIRQVFEDNFGSSVGEKVADKFIDIFETMLAGYRIKKDSDWKKSKINKEDYKKLIKRIDSLQGQVIRKWGKSKKWSREAFIAIACEYFNIDVVPEILHEAASAYWITLTKKAKIFLGAKRLIKKLVEKDRPVFFITSSDGRLKMSSRGVFKYNPEYSEALKRDRIELLRNAGLNFRNVTIGDPEDKPSIEFFMKGIKQAEKFIGKFDLSDCIMVGDSYEGDLSTPHKKLGFGIVVLFEDGRKKLVREGNLIKTGNLGNLLSFL